MDALSLFDKGGPVMYLLLLSSIAVVAIGIERFRFYRYAEKDSEAFLKTLSNHLKNGDFKTCIELCKSEDSSVGFIARSGLEAAVNGENVELSLDTAYTEAAMELRSRLNYLSMIVTMAPLLGLLGTISGMIESFSIFNLQAGQPLAITGGIGEALIATATGLIVAIFALIVHTYFAQRLDEILAVLEKSSAVVLSGIQRQIMLSQAVQARFQNPKPQPKQTPNPAVNPDETIQAKGDYYAAT